MISTVLLDDLLIPDQVMGVARDVWRSVRAICASDGPYQDRPTASGRFS